MTLLIGKGAPDFEANAILESGDLDINFRLSEYIKGDYAVLFFYPMNFFSVCTSEIISFNNRMEHFTSRGVKVVGVSVDSYLSHKMLREKIEKLTGGKQVQFPLVSDSGKSISKTYDVLINDAVSIRGSFIIDKNGNIRYQMVNDLPIGRSVNELIRQIDALEHHYNSGTLCYSGWQKGKAGIANDDEYGDAFLGKYANNL